VELANLISLFFILNLALAGPQLLIIRKHCIDNTCIDAPIVDMKYVLGYNPSVKRNILKILGTLIGVLFLILLIYIVFKFVS